MVTHRTDVDRSLREAAVWFDRLRQDSVSEAVIEAFFAWRRKPENESAYAEIEARWRQADRVRNDPDLVRLTETALRRETATRRAGRLMRRPAMRAALAAVAGGAVLLVGLTLLRPQTLRTAVGVQQIVRLEDGSVLRLNTDSKAQVRYSRNERRLILLRGEGFFEVAHDAARPFVVEAGTAQVKALGTKFDVHRIGGQTDVILVEGRVEVSGGNAQETWTLAPNQKITLGGAVSQPQAADAADATSWTAGRLRFRATPLAAAVVEVNRYSRTKIVLDADHLGAVRVSGVFETGDTQAFVSAVSELFDLDVVARPGGGVLLRGRPPAAAG